MCAVTLFAATLAAAAPAGPDDSSALAERRAALEQRFARMDRNRDGLIAANEAPRTARARCGGSAQPPSWLDAFDRDGDRRVDLSEFVAGSP